MTVNVMIKNPRKGKKYFVTNFFFYNRVKLNIYRDYYSNIQLYVACVKLISLHFLQYLKLMLKFLSNFTLKD